jgi:hypothetical protein
LNAAPAPSHAEAAYWLNDTWWVTAGRNYNDGRPINLLDYAMNPTVTNGVDYYVSTIDADGCNGRLAMGVIKPDPTGQSLSRTIFDFILDLDVAWIRPNVEGNFMNERLFYNAFLRNNIKLTRAEVAKLLCQYLKRAPMRSDQVFADVPSTHTYASYIRAVSDLDLMTGDDQNLFHPDGELTIQEFAVIADRIVDWGKQYLRDLIASGSSRKGSSQMTPAQQLSQIEAAEVAGKPKSFADADKIVPYAMMAVERLSALGILSGDGNGYVKPTDSLDRLRFSVLLFKLDEKFGKTMDGLMGSPFAGSKVYPVF